MYTRITARIYTISSHQPFEFPYLTVVTKLYVSWLGDKYMENSSCALLSPNIRLLGIADSRLPSIARFQRMADTRAYPAGPLGA
jgi:hypothetical protein